MTVHFIGAGPGSSANTGTMFIELKALPGRKSNADQIITRLRPKLAKIEGIHAGADEVLRSGVFADRVHGRTLGLGRRVS